MLHESSANIGIFTYYKLYILPHIGTFFWSHPGVEIYKLSTRNLQIK